MQSGHFVRVDVDWIMSSELSLNGMMATYKALGCPPLRDPDRFYLAIDHTVDPISAVKNPKTVELINHARAFAKTHQIGAFYDVNQTIMHTRFFRQYGRPGQIVVGADSHTTSQGALGALAFGLGGADVAIASLVGSTWLQIPEIVRVNYNSERAFGHTGKDIVLRTLREMGANKAAMERIVEYKIDSGTHLSMDTRFTICNMTAELGGFAGLFEPDATTLAFLKSRGHDINGLACFRADEDAHFSDYFDISLADLAPQVAKPFSPDNVFDVDQVAGQELDGCFIGACTTTEEEIILGGLILEALLDNGQVPTPSTKRLVVPGDMEMRRRLEKTGLLDVYRKAGFRIGVPGCHLCLGIGSERAGDGEIWLSSQNRNYKNRMGKGSLAWLSSAATVAASALDLHVTDPRPVLQCLDQDRYARLIAIEEHPSVQPIYVRPTTPRPQNAAAVRPSGVSGLLQYDIRSQVQLFGDNVDTDAIIPGEFCNLNDRAALGAKSFHYLRPDFAQNCAAGQDIVVAGHGWGCGSSRENAAWALVGAGVKLIIASSFGSIHRRNLINEGVPTLLVDDPSFLADIADRDELDVDLSKGRVTNLRSGNIFLGTTPKGHALDILAGGGVIAHHRAAQNAKVVW